MEASRLNRLETVQAMLLELGQMSTTCSDITEFIRAVHRSLGRIMYAANFYVALKENDEGGVRFVYFVDEVDDTPDPDQVITLASSDQSPTAWVILNRKNLVMTAEEDLAAHPEREGWGMGSTAEHWMGCALLDQQHQALGAIVIQSYSPEHTFSDEDQALFALLANHVSNALQSLQSMDRLEKAVHERTAMLEQKNVALQEAQSELVRQEKLASLGRLVAGVAHEINTPLGICVTATSHLVQELKLTREELAAGAMTQESLESFLDIVDQSLRIMTTNTQRAAALVRSFKQVAVDQSSDDIRNFNLRTYLHEVLLSLQPKLKGRPVKVEIDCPAEILMESFPGAVSQVVTNMVMNSLVHGFEDERPGAITIRAALDDEMVVFDYADDGAGMDADTLAKLFDPFFTTRRGSGGSGLGAHILFNLVTGSLGGTVKVESAPGQGLAYHLRFPRSRRQERRAA
ncbi:GAF domain-containing sensor histidine kinase [Massilia sp. R2A-15]|uniref:sensor histidine kinase n=1 Tax=Massilia sp. R2A-15 TaxID=3064278 RepID=UPI0027374359|nr:GAF domain-containing sensor histidine kinase [Massilia sp. R2A-15]WLI89583.1 GAF domain-containing sensor histidine kinase [Massilia sp. R2A-15]